MNTYKKPLPIVDDLSRPFWEAARNHELCLPQCTYCGTPRIYFERWCAECGSDEFTWAKLSGHGKIWSHCEFHKAYFNGFAESLPYNVVIVSLAEGPRMISNMINLPYEDIHIGMDVEVAFEDIDLEMALVKFRPASAA